MVYGPIIASIMSKLFSAPLLVKKLTLDYHWSDHYSPYNFHSGSFLEFLTTIL